MNVKNFSFGRETLLSQEFDFLMLMSLESRHTFPDDVSGNQRALGKWDVAFIPLNCKRGVRLYNTIASGVIGLVT